MPRQLEEKDGFVDIANLQKIYRSLKNEWKLLNQRGLSIIGSKCIPIFIQTKIEDFYFFYIHYKCIISIILWWHKHFHTLLIFYVSPLVHGIRLGFGANKDKGDEDNVFLFFYFEMFKIHTKFMKHLSYIFYHP